MFCKSACRPSNPATDSVRVDVSAIAGEQPDAAGQVSVRTEEPAGAQAEELAQEQAEAEERRLAEEQRLEEERLAEERLAEERRMEEERRLEEEEKERLRQEEQARRELRLEREGQEAKRREAERLAQEQERERKKAVDTFCKQHGFEGVNAPRRSGCTVWGAAATYPLHVAAELGDASMAELLLKEGADPAVKNSAGKTAAQTAQKNGKAGSHDAVRRLLANPAGARTGGA